MTAFLFAVAPAYAKPPQPVPWPTGAASPTPHLLYYGGPVMAFAQNVEVMWGTHVEAASTTRISAFLDAMARVGPANPYNVALQYGTQGVAPVSSLDASSNQPLTNQSDYLGQRTIAPLTCSGTASCTVHDSDLVKELDRQIDAGALPTPRQAFGGPVTEYYVLFPDNVRVCADDAETACSAEPHRVFCAYHGTAYHDGNTSRPFTYAVIPTHAVAASGACGLNANYLDNETSYVSHELVESVTDPEVGLAVGLAPPLAWYDPQGSNGEIADICNGISTPLTIAGTSFVVQEIWSNLLGACVATWPGHESLAPDFTSSTAGLTTGFDATASSSPNGGITSYRWEFGDGTSGSGPTPSHTYAAGGTYDVTLIVTDGLNTSARRLASVTLAGPPAPPPPPPPPPAPSPPPPPPPAFTPPRCLVPNVLGRLLPAAKARIRARHCRIGRIGYKHSSVRKKNRVLAESPRPGRRLRNGSRINLTVGRGRR